MLVFSTQLWDLYTVKKGSRVSRPQPGCHYQLSLGGNNDVITELFLPMGSLVSDIPAGDGKLVNLFLRCILPCCPSPLLSGSTFPHFPPSLCEYCKYTVLTNTVCKGVYGVLGLRQINTCRKVHLQVSFFRRRHFALVSTQIIIQWQTVFVPGAGRVDCGGLEGCRSGLCESPNLQHAAGLPQPRRSQSH